MSGAQLAKLLIIVGVLLLLAGIIVYFTGNKIFSWLGKLPGDIRIEKENFRFYFPITTMILLSIILSILFRLFRKFF